MGQQDPTSENGRLWGKHGSDDADVQTHRATDNPRGQHRETHQWSRLECLVSFFGSDAPPPGLSEQLVAIVKRRSYVSLEIRVAVD